jgi:outer membrane receptor protein involved in Fe transport
MIHTVVDEQQLSSRLGLIYNLTDRTHLHAGYARYFTPPPTEKIDTTSIAKFANTTNALPSDANTAVKSERSHYFDIGINQEIGSHFLFGLDTYYRRVANLQDEGQFGNALIFSAFNYEEGRVYGAEFTASYAIDKLSIYTNLAYSVAQARNVITGQFNFDSDELDYITNHWVYVDHDQRLAGSAGIAYAYTSIHLSADMLYGSGLRRGFANSEKLPAYAQINIAVSRDFISRTLGAMNIKIAVLNLNDTTYQLRDGSGIGVGASQYGTRRSIYVSLRKSY